MAKKQENEQAKTELGAEAKATEIQTLKGGTSIETRPDMKARQAAPSLSAGSGSEQKAKLVEVPVNVTGKFFGKGYVDVKSIAYNPENGNLSLHLSDKHTLILNEVFQRKYMKVILKQGKAEPSAQKAPLFARENSESSTATMKVLGERNGRVFVGPTGSVKWSGRHSGFVLNFDDKHTTVIDGERLYKQLGLQMVPLAMERQMSIAR